MEDDKSFVSHFYVIEHGINTKVVRKTRPENVLRFHFSHFNLTFNSTAA